MPTQTTKYKATRRILGLKLLKNNQPSEHLAGDIVDLDPEEAAQLVKIGALTPCEPAAQQSQQQTPPPGNSGANTGSKPPEFSKMTKQELVDFAAQTFALKLDVNSTKDEILAAIAEAEATKK